MGDEIPDSPEDELTSRPPTRSDLIFLRRLIESEGITLPE